MDKKTNHKTDFSRLFRLGILFKDNKGIIFLIPKMLFKPKESFSRVLEIATIQKIAESLMVYYSFFAPLVVAYGITIIFVKGISSLSLSQLIFNILASLLMGAITGLSFTTTSIFFVYMISGFYYFFGKFFGSKESFDKVFSVISLYIAGTSILIVPELIVIWIFGNLNIDSTLLSTIFFFSGLFFHIFYLPTALSKGLKLNIYRSIVLMLLPLVFLVGLLLITYKIRWISIYLLILLESY